MGRGLGIAATQDLGAVQEVAKSVEALGFSSMWTNDTPAADGFAVAAAIAGATDSISIGIGVVPMDRRPPETVIARLGELDLPADRLVLGIGAGFAGDPLRLVERSVDRLRSALAPSIRIAVGAMGPAMCRLAGSIADTVLLNWMTPKRIRWAREQISRGAKGSAPKVAAYVRAARREAAIAAEAQRYYSMPHYQRHFDAMAGELVDVGVVLDKDDSGIVPYDKLLDECIVRVLAEDPSEILRLARAAAPAGNSLRTLSSREDLNSM